MGSLRARLMVVWVASLAASLVVGVLLARLSAQSATATAARADSLALRACDRLSDRYAFYATGWSGSLDAATGRDLNAVAQSAGGGFGQSLGFWREEVLAAAPLPPPAVERAALDAAARETLGTGAAARRGIEDAGQDVLLLACPLAGPVPDLVGWVRQVVADAPGREPLRLGVGVLLALVAGIAAWLTWMVADWNRRVGAIARALDAARPLPRTGLAELDRLAAALDAARDRLGAARDRAAANERLAALGRVAAGVAHEIRNPVAAMRLGAENALAGNPTHRGAALEAMLAQLARLDRLVTELLEMTHRRPPQPRAIDLPAFLAALAPGADIACAIPTATFDPDAIGRILAILLDNAARHAPGAAVRITVRHDDALRIAVADDGPGIAPALRDTVFEPFVTGTAEGTGLGLAIARELAEAQGGTLRRVDSSPGAVFEVALWPPS